MRVATANAAASCIIMLFTGLFTLSIGYSLKQDVILWLGAVLLACGALTSVYIFIETLVTCHIQRAFQERQHRRRNQHNQQHHRVRVRNIDPAFVVIYMPPIRPIWPINNCNNMVFCLGKHHPQFTKAGRVAMVRAVRLSHYPHR